MNKFKEVLGGTNLKGNRIAAHLQRMLLTDIFLMCGVAFAEGKSSFGPRVQEILGFKSRQDGGKLSDAIYSVQRKANPAKTLSPFRVR